MPQSKAKPATLEQVARYGHVAAALRAVLKERGWGMPEFNEALGRARGDAGIFKWVLGTGAPNPNSRALISKVTGIPEAALEPRRPGESPPGTALVAAPPPGGAVKLLPPVRTTDPLTFRVTPTGETHIRLDVTLPADKGVPLLRMLLDAGIVFGPVAD
jgi:hypothetical protein